MSFSGEKISNSSPSEKRGDLFDELAVIEKKDERLEKGKQVAKEILEINEGELILSTDQKIFFSHFDPNTRQKNSKDVGKVIVDASGLTARDEHFDFDESVKEDIHSDSIREIYESHPTGKEFFDQLEVENQKWKKPFLEISKQQIEVTQRRIFIEKSNQEIKEYRSQFDFKGDQIRQKIKEEYSNPEKRRGLEKIVRKDPGKERLRRDNSIDAKIDDRIREMQNDAYRRAFEQSIIEDGQISREEYEDFQSFNGHLEDVVFNKLEPHIPKHEKSTKKRDEGDPYISIEGMIPEHVRALRRGIANGFKDDFVDKHPEYAEYENTLRDRFHLQYYSKTLEEAEVDFRSFLTKKLNGVSEVEADELIANIKEECEYQYGKLAPIVFEHQIKWNRPLASDMNKKEAKIRAHYKKQYEETYSREAAEDTIERNLMQGIFPGKDIERAYILPTGAIAILNDPEEKISAKSVFPLDEEFITQSIPKKNQRAWRSAWKIYQEQGYMEHYNQIARNRISKDSYEFRSENPDSATDLEKRLAVLKKKYQVPEFFNKKTGIISGEFLESDLDIIEAIPEKLEPFVNQIDLRDHFHQSQKISAKGLKEEIRKYFIGESRAPLIAFEKGEFRPRNVLNMIERADEDISGIILAEIACNIFETISKEQKQEFASLVQDKLSFSRKSFIRAFKIQPRSLRESREITSRAVFVSEFRKYLEEKSSSEDIEKFFDDLAKEYKEQFPS